MCSGEMTQISIVKTANRSTIGGHGELSQASQTSQGRFGGVVCNRPVQVCWDRQLVVQSNWLIVDPKTQTTFNFVFTKNVLQKKTGQQLFQDENFTGKKASFSEPSASKGY